MKSISKLTQLFDNILQRDVEIMCGRKVIRKGTFILYTIKDYVITMIIKTPTTNKSYDIYYPFDVTHENNAVTLDYTLDKLLSKNISIKLDPAPGCNKFLDKKLEIKYV